MGKGKIDQLVSGESLTGLTGENHPENPVNPVKKMTNLYPFEVYASVQSPRLRDFALALMGGKLLSSLWVVFSIVVFEHEVKP